MVDLTSVRVSDETFIEIADAMNQTSTKFRIMHMEDGWYVRVADYEHEIVGQEVGAVFRNWIHAHGLATIATACGTLRST